GFTVLILAFATVSALTVLAMQRLSNEVRVIRVGYLRLALTAKDLYEKQKNLSGYLRELPGEKSTQKVSFQLIRLRGTRTPILNEADKIISEMQTTSPPSSHRKAITITIERRAQFRELARKLEDDYKVLLQFPPLER